MGIIYRYAQMVIKTDPCSFTELRIYPGRGSKFAAKDGKTHMFISSKARSLFHQKIKPVKLTWTQASRRFNKKIKVAEIQKKRTRRTTRVQKAVVGIVLMKSREREPRMLPPETSNSKPPPRRSRLELPRNSRTRRSLPPRLEVKPLKLAPQPSRKLPRVKSSCPKDELPCWQSQMPTCTSEFNEFISISDVLELVPYISRQ